MSSDSARLSRATPVLRIADYPRARAFYTERLGFRVCEEGGDPARFGIVERQGAVVFLDSWHGGPPERREGWDAYFHVQRLDALVGEFSQAGVELARPVTETGYGMRELEVRDPDGNLLCFGESAD